MMEFNDINLINTTTQLTLNTTDGGNSGAAVIISYTSNFNYIFDRKTTQFEATSSDTTTAFFNCLITFLSPQEIDRVVIQNHNFKEFAFGDASAVAFITLTSGDTSLSWWEGNSATNHYCKFIETKTITAFVLQCSHTISPENENKKISELWLGENKFQLERNPSSNQYQPRFNRVEINHEMSDGGMCQYVIDKTFETDIELTYQSDSMTSELSTLYNSRDPFVFVPYPTGVSWAGEVYQVNWVSGYDFIQPAKGDTSSYGWSGNMRLRETAK